MELRPLLRPAAQLLVRLPAPANLCPTRGHKTASRTKRALKQQAHHSFLPSRSIKYPTADSIIHNPPASEASPYHTPFLFLPPEDPRRQDMVVARCGKKRRLPKPLKYPRRERQYNLTIAQMEQMRQLRLSDPVTWSVGHLSRYFNCSPVFVRMVAPPPASHTQWIEDMLEAKRQRWGSIKKRARLEREWRAEMMYRGEL